MVDIPLLVNALKSAGYTVGHVNPLPANAGDYEFEVDGQLLTLVEVRALLEEEAERPRSDAE